MFTKGRYSVIKEANFQGQKMPTARNYVKNKLTSHLVPQFGGLGLKSGYKYYVICVVHISKIIKPSEIDMHNEISLRRSSSEVGPKD